MVDKHVAVGAPLLSRDMTKKKRKEKKLRNALFSLITEEILGVTVKPSRLEQSARDEMRLKNARKCTKSHSEVYFCLKIGHNFS